MSSNEAVEQVVLGFLLENPDAVHEVIGSAPAKPFSDPRHAELWSLMIECHESRGGCGIVQVSSLAKEKKKVREIGGLAYLTSLVDGVPKTLDVPGIVASLKKNYLLRSASELVTECQKRLEDGESPEQVLALLGSRTFDALSEGNKKDFSDSSENAGDVVNEAVDAALGIGTKHIRTGFYGLDAATGPLYAGDLVLIGARPSVGKTALMLNMLIHAARYQGKRVGIFSLEMPRAKLCRRMICEMAGINSRKLKEGTMTSGEWSLFLKAAIEFWKLPIWIDDTTAPTITEMKAKARRLKLEHDVDVIGVDYIQLASAGDLADVSDKNATVGAISKGLKQMARELDIVVVALSQLSRYSERRSDGSPRMSDLRDSGALEQDADVVIFPERPEQAGATPQNVGKGTLNVGKNRDGDSGEKAPCLFIKTLSSYYNGRIFLT